jgi:hypothetical protein
MDKRRLVITFSLGLGLTLALLWLLGREVPTTACAQGPDGESIYYVTPGGNCGLGVEPCFDDVQAAVDAADDAYDVIKVATGVYTGVNGYGGLSQVLYISKTVTVRGGYTSANWDISNPEANPTTLDALALGRALVISGTITPTVEGLRITGGDATGLGGPGGDDGGGGIYAHSAMVTISNCVVVSNTASSAVEGLGGGLLLYKSAAILSGNTVKNNIANTGYYGYGGGLYLWDSAATLSNNLVLGNTASIDDDGFGGGLYLRDSAATLSGNLVQGNVASRTDWGYGYGGGLYLYESAATLSDNTIQDNIANTANYGFGGGLCLNRSDATVNSNLVQGNIASIAGYGDGGGLSLSDSAATLSNNLVLGNTASTDADGCGGGLSLSRSPALLSGNTIVSNTATLSPTAIGQGGGLSLYGSNLFTLTNNLVIDNHANTEGGGLWFDGASFAPGSGRLLHNTIADNDVSSGQSVYVGDYNTLAFTNTIVAGHHGVGVTVTTGSTVTMEGTLWYDNGADTGGAGTILTGMVNVYDDPAFANPATWDYHLGLDSPAIDGGVDAGVTGDIDGETRPAGNGYDIGADEFWWRIHFPLIMHNRDWPDQLLNPSFEGMVLSQQGADN